MVKGGRAAEAGGLRAKRPDYRMASVQRRDDRERAAACGKSLHGMVDALSGSPGRRERNHRGRETEPVQKAVKKLKTVSGASETAKGNQRGRHVKILYAILP